MPSLNKCTISAPRFIRPSNKSEFLSYTDGAYSKDGNKDARGGCAFIYCLETSPSTIPLKTLSGYSIYSMNLYALGASKLQFESRGPTREARSQTNNRATTWSQPVRRMFGSWNMAPQKKKSSREHHWEQEDNIRQAIGRQVVLHSREPHSTLVRFICGSLCLCRTICEGRDDASKP